MGHVSSRVLSTRMVLEFLDAIHQFSRIKRPFFNTVFVLELHWPQTSDSFRASKTLLNSALMMHPFQIFSTDLPVCRTLIPFTHAGNPPEEDRVCEGGRGGTDQRPSDRTRAASMARHITSHHYTCIRSVCVCAHLVAVQGVLRGAGGQRDGVWLAAALALTVQVFSVPEHKPSPVSACVYLCLYMRLYVCECVCTCAHMCLYVCLYTCVYMGLYMCVHVFIHVCTSVCTYTSICV